MQVATQTNRRCNDCTTPAGLLVAASKLSIKKKCDYTKGDAAATTDIAQCHQKLQLVASMFRELWSAEMKQNA